MQPLTSSLSLRRRIRNLVDWDKSNLLTGKKKVTTDRTQEKWVMQSAIVHYPQSHVQPIPNSDQSSFQRTPSVYGLGMILCVLELPFGQLRSAVPALPFPAFCAPAHRALLTTAKPSVCCLHYSHTESKTWPCTSYWEDNELYPIWNQDIIINVYNVRFETCYGFIVNTNFPTFWGSLFTI